MGNSSKKLARECELLQRDEQKYLASTFKSVSRSDKMREDEIIKYWGSQIDPRLAQYLSNFLFGFGPDKQSQCDFNKFAELYVFNMRGTPDEKTKALFECLGKEYSPSTVVSYQLLREYCESVVSTYIRMIKCSRHPAPKLWIEKGFRGKANHVQALGEAVASTVAADPDNPNTEYPATEVTQWITGNSLLAGMSETVFESLYGVTEGREKRVRDLGPASQGEGSAPQGTTLLPHPDGISTLPDYPAFVDLSHLVWLNQQIPHKHREHWRFLFSSHIHGESFSTMAGRIQDVGASVVIIEDNSGYIFGGYASESWKLSPDFYGDDSSFLFTLAPKMRIYHATSFNNHYQYMNFQTKTLPNGLMMGGQFEFGAIWVTADPFGEGTSAESCSTYRGYKRLSKEPVFKIRSIEVWAVGDKPLTLRDSDERDPSILDRNPEAKAILEMAGKTRHSEGLREPEPL
ncbi:hypothetical protein O0L34_g3547 [Tuta absoluta]|nr:hypothetical protein O0L34_g3547 [Tuta absoluta]